MQRRSKVANYVGNALQEAANWCLMLTVVPLLVLMLGGAAALWWAKR